MTQHKTSKIEVRLTDAEKALVKRAIEMDPEIETMADFFRVSTLARANLMIQVNLGMITEERMIELEMQSAVRFSTAAATADQ